MTHWPDPGLRGLVPPIYFYIISQDKVCFHMIYTNIIAFIWTSFFNTILTIIITDYRKLEYYLYIYPLWIVVWIVDNLLYNEHLFRLLGLTNNLDPGVELSAHYHQVLRLRQGVDGGPGAKRTCLVLCPL